MTPPRGKVYPDSQTKRCANCKIDKALDEFFRDATATSGRKPSCKECHAKYTALKTEHFRIARLNYKPPLIKVCSNPDCKYLGVAQPISSFSKNTHNRDGLNCRCRDCTYKGNAKWASENKAYKSDYRRRYKQRDYYAKRESQWHITAARRLKVKAKRESIPFAMTPQDLLDQQSTRLPEFCPVFTHIKLDYAAGPDRRMWASVDRIVPELGYVSGNVCIVSMAANIWKNNGSNAAERKRIVEIMRGKRKPVRGATSGFLFPEMESFG